MTTYYVRDVLAERLRAERQKKNISRAALAEMLSCKTPSTIGNWESGVATPDYEKLVFLADLYNVSTDYLLGRAEQPFGEVEDDVKPDAPTSKASKIAQEFDFCDEDAQLAIENMVHFYYLRSTQEIDSNEGGKTVDTEKTLFLDESKDSDYATMKDKLPYLKALRKSAKKSCVDITRYLWKVGYENKISITNVLEIFGTGLKQQVPCKELFYDIEMYLKGYYTVVKNVRGA